MWAAIISVLAILTIAGAVYLVTRFHRFSCVKKTGEKRPVLSWIMAALPVLAAGLLMLTKKVPAVIVALLHLVVAFLLCDLAALVLRKVFRTEFSHDARGVTAILLTVLVLGAGWFAAHRVFETDYSFATDKDVGRDIRIVEIADAHLGITLDGESFARQTERIQALKPDAVVVVGDFVDDDSTLEDLTAACRALG